MWADLQVVKSGIMIENTGLVKMANVVNTPNSNKNN